MYVLQKCKAQSIYDYLINEFTPKDIKICIEWSMSWGNKINFFNNVCIKAIAYANGYGHIKKVI